MTAVAERGRLLGRPLPPPPVPPRPSKERVAAALARTREGHVGRPSKEGRRGVGDPREHRLLPGDADRPKEAGEQRKSSFSLPGVRVNKSIPGDPGEELRPPLNNLGSVVVEEARKRPLASSVDVQLHPTADEADRLKEAKQRPEKSRSIQDAGKSTNIVVGEQRNSIFYVPAVQASAMFVGGAANNARVSVAVEEAPGGSHAPSARPRDHRPPPDAERPKEPQQRPARPRPAQETSGLSVGAPPAGCAADDPRAPLNNLGSSRGLRRPSEDAERQKEKVLRAEVPMLCRDAWNFVNGAPVEPATLSKPLPAGLAGNEPPRAALNDLSGVEEARGRPPDEGRAEARKGDDGRGGDVNLLSSHADKAKVTKVVAFQRPHLVDDLIVELRHSSQQRQRIRHADWEQQGVRYSACRITLEDPPRGFRPRREPMAAPPGLPPLPKSLSGASLSEVSAPPDLPQQQQQQQQPRASAPAGNPRPRKPTGLDAQLALLRKEMLGLRQLDFSLLSQLWSLHESIQELRQLMQEQEEGAAFSPPSPSSADECDDVYSPLRYPPALLSAVPEQYRLSGSSSPSSSEY